MIRERNVLITVSVSGQESGHGFGPVPDATLMACARAVATSVLAKAKSGANGLTGRAGQRPRRR